MTGTYMTKEQIINFVKGELECGNSILVATLGNGGAGEDIVNNIDFAEFLKSLDFVGEVEPSADIVESANYDSTWRTYQFNGENGFVLQLQAE